MKNKIMNHRKPIPDRSVLVDLRNRLNNGRCSIRKLSQELYGDKRPYHLYRVLQGVCYDPDALERLRKLAITGNVIGIEHRRGGGRPHRKTKVKLIKCKCPKCEKIYYRTASELNWTNPVIKVPRVFCDPCAWRLFPPDGDPTNWESYEQLREEEFQRESIDRIQ